MMLALVGCSSSNGTIPSENVRVRIKTSEGKIVIRLYDETPGHRDNFIKIAQEGALDGTLFHRVINEFMIQGGDPNSKDARKGQLLGDGDLGYTVPAEFNFPEYFHKRGVLAAAREGDQVNPEKASSACQFYIVTGKVYSEEDLDKMENQRRQQEINTVFNSLAEEHAEEIQKLRDKGDREGLLALQDSLSAQVDRVMKSRPRFRYTQEQRQIYTTIGGTPHLDGNYTVFGEVIEGMDVVEKIEQSRTDGNDRPYEDVVIKSVKVLAD